MSNNSNVPCKYCGRTKKEHESPPFEYAALLYEQLFNCRHGYTPRWK